MPYCCHNTTRDHARGRRPMAERQPSGHIIQNQYHTHTRAFFRATEQVQQARDEG